MIRRAANSGFAAVLLLCVCFAAQSVRAGEVVVFAAASLKTALDRIAGDFEMASGDRVLVSLAGSSALARQIAYGAPADVFISANPAWMDFLEESGRVEAASRRDLLGNRLVLIAPFGEALSEPVTGPDVQSLLGDGRLAMAMVDAVPAGQYGKAALESLGVWDAVRGSVVQVDNVRAALAVVALGEATVGLVYETDARASEDVVILGFLPQECHPRIVYPAAALKGRGAISAPFLAYLESPEAGAVFIAQGFEFKPGARQ